MIILFIGIPWQIDLFFLYQKVMNRTLSDKFLDFNSRKNVFIVNMIHQVALGFGGGVKN